MFSVADVTNNLCQPYDPPGEYLDFFLLLHFLTLLMIQAHVISVRKENVHLFK